MTWKPWKWPLAQQILAGLLLGAVLGLVAKAALTSPQAVESLAWWITNVIQPVGRLFIRIIFMIVIPLIFSAIVLGIAEMGDIRKVGRVGVRALFFTLLVSGISVVIGVTLVNLLEPGRHLDSEARQELIAA